MAIVAGLGAAAGVWLERSNTLARVERAADRIGTSPATQVVPWQPVSSHYHQLQVATLRISSVSATGGAISEVGRHLLIASPQGTFSYLDSRYQLRALPIRTRMNLEGLRNDPLYDDPRFQVTSLRTHDLLSVQVAQNQFEVYASFDRFTGHCIEFVIARIHLRVDDDEIVADGRWTDVWRATPCLRFKDRGSLVEGWQQGGRMVRAGPDTLLVTIGDYQRDGFYDSQAVSMSAEFDHGKLIELNTRTGAARRLAIGLRNPQGLTIDASGRIWETEHGPQGGDEINLLVAGGNYGWPVTSLGMSYGSPPTPWRSEAPVESDGPYTAPTFAFVPSIGISNVVIPDEREFPNWSDCLLVGSLRAQSLYVVKFSGDKVVFTEPIPFGHRLRDIAVLRRGWLAILADGGQLLFVRSARPMRADAPLVVDGLTSLPPPSLEEAPGLGLGAAARGRAYFAGSCATCHSIAGDVGIGPPLDGVLGRAVASVDAFGYSESLRRLGGTWTTGRLASYIHLPESVAPGTTMSATGLHDGESEDVAAFLATVPSHGSR